MAAWQPAVDDWFRSHHGIAHIAQLERLGISARTVRRMVEREQLLPMLPGVFRSRQWPESLEQRCAAACARNSSLLIGFTTADRLWVRTASTCYGLHVLVPHGLTPDLPGIVVHRCRRIDPVDVVERPDGIRAGFRARPGRTRVGIGRGGPGRSGAVGGKNEAPRTALPAEACAPPGATPQR